MAREAAFTETLLAEMIAFVVGHLTSRVLSSGLVRLGFFRTPSVVAAALGAKSPPNILVSQRDMMLARPVRAIPCALLCAAG